MALPKLEIVYNLRDNTISLWDTEAQTWAKDITIKNKTQEFVDHKNSLSNLLSSISKDTKDVKDIVRIVETWLSKRMRSKVKETDDFGFIMFDKK